MYSINKLSGYATLVLLFASHLVCAGYPEIGKPCPDYQLNNLQNYTRATTSVQKLKGKFVVLEFWNKYCSACLTALPKTDQLARQYRNKLEIILVGQKDKHHRIDSLYKTLEKRFHLDLAFTFDSSLYKQAVHAGAPFLVWINNEGIVKAITTAWDLNAPNIESFLQGKEFRFKDFSYKASQKIAKSYDHNKPFLTDGNGGEDTDFMYRSLLAEYRIGMPTTGVVKKISSAVQESGVHGCTGLRKLYLLAYFGYSSWTDEDEVYLKFFPKLALEIKDTTVFTTDYHTPKNVYWYSQTIPLDKVNEETIARVMQNDLENYFQYHVTIEERSVPCWEVFVTDSAKANLKSKSRDKSSDRVEHTGLKLTNVSMSNLIHNAFHKHIIGKIPIVDRTGITENVDLEFNAYMDDFESIVKALKTNGIIVKRGTRKMKVLVIKDENT